MPDPSFGQMASTPNSTEIGLPKVSVIIRVFDRREYIAEAIESVLAQTYPHVEIIVVDNGSPTPIKDVLEPFWPKIRYVYKPRGSVGSAANVGVAHATGEFVAFLDDDDLWDQETLEVTTRAMRESGADGVFVRWRIFCGRDTASLYESYAEPYFRLLEDGKDPLEILCHGNVLSFSGVVLRRSSLSKAGGFDETLQIGEDWDLWLRMLSVGFRIQFINTLLSYVRRHDQNITAEPVRLLQQEVAVLKKALGYIPRRYKRLVRRTLAERQRGLGETLVDAGSVRQGLMIIGESVITFPPDLGRIRQIAGRILTAFRGPLARAPLSHDDNKVPRRGEDLTVRPQHGEAMRKRVVFVARSNVFGGTEKTLIDCVVRFDLTKVKPIVVCFGGDPYGSRFAAYPDVDVDLYGGVVWRGAIGLWLRLMRLRPFSIVFVNSCRGLFPWTAYLAARSTFPKRVCAIEQLLSGDAGVPIEPTGLINRLRRLVGVRARQRCDAKLAGWLSDRTICVSDAVRTKLVVEWDYPEEAMSTIRNGTDLSRYVPAPGDSPCSNDVRVALGIPEGEPVLLCVARLSEQKGIAILLKALSLFSSSGPRVWTIVVGDGPLRGELETLATDLGLGSTVFFAGHREDVRPYYEAATLFVLPSLIEGFPLALLEAMACGLPCIVAEIDGIKEAISHGVDGLLVPPASPEALRVAIEHLLNHDQERLKIGINARQRAARQFDIEVTAKKTQAAVLGVEA